MERPGHRDMARELDSMERDVTSWEANFIESVLKALRSGKSLSNPQKEKLEEMWDKYLGERADKDAPPRDEDEDLELD
jgi:hypothetical protein